MSSDHSPNKQLGSNAVGQFLKRAQQLPQRSNNETRTSGRLIFALDATASRQPSWDKACQLQGQMFLATAQLGGLDLQLCYYRGLQEFHYSGWMNNSAALLHTMSNVQCLGGYTQLERVLQHSLKENSRQPVQAVIIIADAVEENVDTLCAKAGQLGLLGVPLFMFQEGHDTMVRQCFQQMAKLTKGAYATFDEHSAKHLADLLAAVATFASGGKKALQQLPSSAAQQLLQQLKS